MTDLAPRILHVAAVEFTARYLLAPQLGALADAGYDVRLACQPLGDEFHESLRRFNPTRIGFPRATDFRSMTSASTRLLRLLKEFRPDLVHFHSPAAALPGRLAMTLRGPHRPLIAYTVHGFPFQWDRTTVHTGWLRSAEWLLSFVTDLVLFQSREDLIQAQNHNFRGRLSYLGNGVGDEWFTGHQAAEAQPTEQPLLRAVFVGRLTEEKGVLDLLEALRHTSKVELTIIGEALPSDRDPVSREAQDLVRTAGLPVNFLGHLEPRGIRGALHNADVFVLPSWREGLPRSIIEAMACGLPIITSDIRGCRELVTEGVTGWLVPPRDPVALAHALNHVAALDRKDLSPIGCAAFRKVDSGYRESQTFARLLRAYGQLGLSP